ncbi:MAG TPA: hypothetical protein VN441_02115 [Syntrophomonas sp.]|nr:hypothetical protein [Syntrophomonas sp.]
MLDLYLLENTHNLVRQDYEVLLNCISAGKKSRLSRLRQPVDIQRSLLGDLPAARLGLGSISAADRGLRTGLTA